ncbi:hypothetical protein ACVJBD_005565 [Rhizobium mongolense]
MVLVKPGAANLFREIAGVKAEFDTLAPDRLAKFRRDEAGALDGVFVRIDFRFDEAADRFDDHLLFFVESKIHDELQRF